MARYLGDGRWLFNRIVWREPFIKPKFIKSLKKRQVFIYNDEFFAFIKKIDDFSLGNSQVLHFSSRSTTLLANSKLVLQCPFLTKVCKKGPDEFFFELSQVMKKLEFY